VTVLLGLGILGIPACNEEPVPPPAAPVVEIPAAVPVAFPPRAPAPEVNVAAGGADALYPRPAVRSTFTPCRFAGPSDPIVVADGRLTVIRKQDVPCQRDGVLLVIGDEVQPGEEVPPDRRVEVAIDNKVKVFRCWKEDDRVEAGQLLAWVDDQLTRCDLAMKQEKHGSCQADLVATEKTRDEARNRFERQLRLFHGRAGSLEETDAARLLWERYVSDAVAKRKAVGMAEQDIQEARTVLEMHQVRATIPGIIKTIVKKRGEAIKTLETVVQLHDLSRLRIEGLVGVQYLNRLSKGMTVVVEPSRSERPLQTLLGHLQDVTAVAVTNDLHQPLIVSASEDGSVRLWDRASRRERHVLWHPAPVKAVACSPVGASGNWCLTGAADGVARLWHVQRPAEPSAVLQGQHRGAVTCVAFSPDGKTCATGGDDRAICLWNTESGTLRYRFPEGHRGAVTSLQFTPQSQLVSAGRDNTLRVWTLGKRGARLLTTLDRRSGDVAQPGVSPDGKLVLLDQGKVLRLLTLADKLTEAELQNPSDPNHFASFALFSPDARLILTAGAAEGRLRLWRSPTAATRPYELSQLLPPDEAPATCAAFAPDGSFLVTGTRDRKVLVWPLPSRRTIEHQVTAEITLLEPVVESSNAQVRIWAEVDNRDGRLLPGTTATLAIYPQERQVK
jgi:WD40 repeat protein